MMSGNATQQKGTPSMDSKKYIGMDMHKESISIAVMNGARKIGMECAIETKTSMILQLIDGLRGDLQVTFEEGASAAWLYDLLKPYVTKLAVCDSRKNASMREGHQSDKIPPMRRLAITCFVAKRTAIPAILTAGPQPQHLRLPKARCRTVKTLAPRNRPSQLFFARV
jgi:hypothetical protein